MASIEAGSNTEAATATSGGAVSCRSFLQKASDAVNACIVRGFRSWSRVVCNRPWTVILFAVIVAAAWTFALNKTYETEVDNTDLFTPKETKSFDDYDYVRELYGTLAGRARLVSVRNRELIDREDCTTRLLLKDEETARESVQDFFKIYEAIRDLEVVYEGEIYTLEDVCIRPTNHTSCRLTSILDVWNYDAGVINAPDFNPLERINADDAPIDAFGFPLEMVHYLGKNEDRHCEPETDQSTNVEAFGMTILYINEPVENKGTELDPESLAWVQGAINLIREMSKTMSIDSYMADEFAVFDQQREVAEDDMRLLPLGGFLVLSYTIAVLWKNNWAACKAHLSFAALSSVVIAILGGFGFVSTIGFKVNTLVQILPFLILSLGIDDAFVIVGTYQKTDHALSVEDRIAQTLETAGSSILLTSATDFSAFIMGLYTRLPGIRAFAVYAAVSVMSDFFFQVTFFVAFLVLDARREVRYRNGTPCVGLAFCCAKSTPEPQEITEAATDEGTTAPKPSRKAIGAPNPNPRAAKKICGEGEFDPQKPNFSQKLIGQYLASVSLHPVGRFAVLAVECLLLAAAVYGCLGVKMDFRYIEWFTSKGSSLRIAYDLESEYFFGNQVLFAVYTKEAQDDYYYHQEELLALKTALDDNPFVVGPVNTWYDGFSSWFRAEKTDDLVDGSVPDATAFNSWLQEYLDGPGLVFKDSVTFRNESSPRVTSSSISATSVEVLSGQRCVDLIDSVRIDVKEAAPSLDAIAFSGAFLFCDGFRYIKQETVRNIVMAASGVLVMNVIILASIHMSLIIVVMISLTDIVVVGYMWFVGLDISVVTTVALVLVVGVAVDYSSHIAFSFLQTKGSRQERARTALNHIGGEVFAGAFTTWLGTMVLVLAKNYLFVAFFQMFIAVVVVGAWHGLVLLPVVLSFCGSPPYSSSSIGAE